jgi:hypothetical protein
VSRKTLAGLLLARADNEIIELSSRPWLLE